MSWTYLLGGAHLRSAVPKRDPSRRVGEPEGQPRGVEGHAMPKYEGMKKAVVALQRKYEQAPASYLRSPHITTSCSACTHMLNVHMSSVSMYAPVHTWRIHVKRAHVYVCVCRANSTRSRTLLFVAVPSQNIPADAVLRSAVRQTWAPALQRSGGTLRFFVKQPLRAPEALVVLLDDEVT